MLNKEQMLGLPLFWRGNEGEADEKWYAVQVSLPDGRQVTQRC
jgi:hypothetical protein